jgi:hypothetical protein
MWPYNWSEDDAEGSSIGEINILSATDSTVNYKLGDEYISCSHLNNNNCYSKHQMSTNILRGFLQNIRGLKYKTDELLHALCPDFPHVLCLTEHHMNSLERNSINIDHYNLGAVYCRKILGKGGVCIFVHNSINYSNINLDTFCIDQIIEICAVKLLSVRRNICIVAVYRAPSGNFLLLLNSLDRALNIIYSSGAEFIVCGDINVNYLKDSYKKSSLILYHLLTFLL